MRAVIKRFLRVLPAGLVVLVVIATWVGLALKGRDFEVARQGTSAEYWEHLCGVQLESFKGHHNYSRNGGVFPIFEGELYFFDQMHHEQLLYTVKPEDVLGSAAQVRTALAIADHPIESSCYADGVDRCSLYKRSVPKREACRSYFSDLGTKQLSVPNLEEIRKLVAKRNTEALFETGSSEELHARVDRGRHVWLSIAFEAIYLTAWWAFFSWRLFSNRSVLSWRWHVSLSPFLLFLPYFLGYAPMTFTYGPSGGFVYPGYLIVASIPLYLIPCSKADGFVWNLFPQFLGPLSQIPGSPLAASYMTCVGPVSSTIAGLVLIAVLSATPILLGSIKSWWVRIRDKNGS